MPESVELATAYVSIIASARGLRREIDKEVQGAEKGAQASGKRAGGVFARGLVAGVAAFGVGRIFTDLTSASSDLEQSTGGLKAIFKDSFGVMSKESRDAATSLGLSRNEYNELANTLGAGLKNQGIKDYAASTQDLLGIGSDLSAQFGGSTREAVEALASAMRGESDPIEKYGISLNETAVNAELARRGQDGLKGEALTLAKAQARLSIISKQSADAQGAFARESNTAAGQGQRLKAQVENVKASLGDALLPVLTDAGKVLNEDVVPAVAEFIRQWRESEGTGGRVRDVLGSITGFLRDNWRVIGSLVAAYATYRVGLAAWTAAQRAATAATRVYHGVQKAAHAASAAWTAGKYSLAAAQRTYTATIRGGTGARTANTIAERAGIVAGKAKIVVTKAMAVAQRLLNAAMRANPIGLIVTAIMLLVGALVVAYKQHEGFRNLVTRVWAAIKGAALAVVTWFRDTAWPWMQRVFSAIGGAAMRMWSSYISPALSRVLALGRLVFGWVKNTGWPWMRTAFQAIGGVAMRMWSSYISPALSRVLALGRLVFGWVKNTGWPWMRTAFQAIGGVVSWLWGAYKRYLGFMLSRAQSVFGWILDTGWPIMRSAFQQIGDKASWLWNTAKKSFDSLKSGVGAVKDAFVKAKDGIVFAWNKVKKGISDPIVAVLSWLDKHFIAKVKQLLNAVGLKSLSVKIPYFKVKGFATGGWTGPGSKYAPAGVVHADEYVIKKSSRRRFERENPGALDHINQTGRMPGYAGGGYVYPAMVSWIKKAMPGIGISSTKRNWGTGSYHDAGKAIDIVGSGAQMKRAAQLIMSNFGTKIAELIHNPGFSVKNGKKVPPSFWGASTWANHGPRNWHVHWAMNSMSGKGGALSGVLEAVGGTLSGFAAKVASGGREVLDKILEKVPGGKTFLGQMTVAPFKMAVPGIFKKFEEAASSFMGGGDDPSTAPAGSGVEKWRSTVLKALGIVGQPKSLANTVLRRMNQESGGNARAQNNWDSNAAMGVPSKGLMQVIPPTFAAYAHPEYNRNIWDPLSNILASMRYALARYGSLSSAYNRAGGYAEGGRVTPAVFDNGGILAPGINVVHNRLGKPEALVRPEQYDWRSGGPVVMKLVDSDGVLLGTIRGEIDDHQDHMDRLSRRGA